MLLREVKAGFSQKPGMTYLSCFCTSFEIIMATRWPNLALLGQSSQSPISSFLSSQMFCLSGVHALAVSRISVPTLSACFCLLREDNVTRCEYIGGVIERGLLAELQALRKARSEPAIRKVNGVLLYSLHKTEALRRSQSSGAQPNLVPFPIGIR